MRYREIREAYDDSDPRNKAILLDMLNRANLDDVREWLIDNGTDEEDLADPDLFLWEFAYWLEQERSIEVREGIVWFWRLEHDCSHLIADHPIGLYHYTNNYAAAKIKRDGLVGDQKSVNNRTEEGVYLTTESSGPAVRGYIWNAVRARKGSHGVCVTVKTFLRDISPDPDDSDIVSGQTQFITDYVAPSQIIGIGATPL
jgi:hypothetical protein